MSEWKTNYEIWHPESANETFAWSVVSEIGGVHLWIRKTPKIEGYTFRDNYYGGVEAHYRIPPKGYEITQGDCWLLNGPCYHDGSSLLASTDFIPFWEKFPDDHEILFAKLIAVANSRFNEEEDYDD